MACPRNAVGDNAAFATVAKDRPVILAGDFDAVPEAAGIRFWHGLQSLNGTSAGHQDAWDSTGSAPPDRLRDGRLRRTGPRLRVTSCHLAFDQPVAGVWASDHFGVVADFEPLAPRR